MSMIIYYMLFFNRRMPLQQILLLLLLSFRKYLMHFRKSALQQVQSTCLPPLSTATQAPPLMILTIYQTLLS